MGKKRKREYVDRAANLHASLKRPNFCVGLQAEMVERLGLGSLERHFTHKLRVDDPNYLIAMVLANDICVLVAPHPIKAESVNFAVDTSGISGKMKKGAQKIIPGSTIITWKSFDSISHQLLSPIGGRLLEINESLVSNPNLIFDQTLGCGYIAVIFPDTQLPTPNSSVPWDTIEKGMKSGNDVCFSFLRGNCSRGEQCKFKHDAI